MRKVISVLAAVGVLGLAAAPAVAENTGTQPPGPPTASGQGSAKASNVGHCPSINGKPGAAVAHSDGTVTGSGNC
jgi:uncharacterized low-complexity protein